jgi:cellulose synthase/poly-beta-1,6-N-acetylglucosamine synthase-like glycosyltransferase
VLYLLVFALAGIFYKQRSYYSVRKKNNIVLLIPVYREDEIILQTVTNVLSQNYPSNHFDVIVIADQLKEETIKRLTSFPIQVIQVSFEKSTKAKSIKYALKQTSTDYDILMILDSDNLLGQDCLEKVNHAFQKGFNVIQLHRTAKNRNTATAVLDAASEEINNHIFRKGHRSLGLSSALIGSGMAFDYPLFKKIMMESDIEDNPGEDREIYLELLKANHVCEYIDSALVYDEKVQSGKVLEKQRTRWLSAQLQYAKRFWISDLPKTFTYNIHYLDYAVQTLLLPRVLLLLVTFMLLALSLLISAIIDLPLIISNGLWSILFAGNVLSLGLSVYGHLSLTELKMAVINLPKTSWSFIKALMRSSSKQRDFIHTPKEFINERLEVEQH